MVRQDPHHADRRLATRCSRSCRASARRCWCAPWPERSTGHQPHPVHAGPDAGGHRWDEHHRLRRAASGASASTGTHQQQPGAGRRDQPRTPRPSRRCSRPCRSIGFTVAKQQYTLSEPFFVLATQNPHSRWRGPIPCPRPSWSVLLQDRRALPLGGGHSSRSLSARPASSSRPSQGRDRWPRSWPCSGSPARCRSPRT